MAAVRQPPGKAARTRAASARMRASWPHTELSSLPSEKPTTPAPSPAKALQFGAAPPPRRAPAAAASSASAAQGSNQADQDAKNASQLASSPGASAAPMEAREVDPSLYHACRGVSAGSVHVRSRVGARTTPRPSCVASARKGRSSSGAAVRSGEGAASPCTTSDAFEST